MKFATRVHFAVLLTFVGGSCGNPVQNSARSIAANYIIGGVDAKKDAAPYQVSLQHYGQHFCGGSIVGDRWILTAAHCLPILNSASSINSFRTAYYVLAGTVDLLVRGSKYAVDRAFPYDPFDANYTLYVNDIALIRLARPMKFSERVKKIEYSPEHVPNNETLILTGWGLTEDFKTFGKLQTMEALSMDFKSCNASNNIRNEGYICSFVPNERRGVCDGDSGSPVTWKGKQVGIIRAVAGKCVNGFPDMHTSISYYYDWIKKTIASNESNNC